MQEISKRNSAGETNGQENDGEVMHPAKRNINDKTEIAPAQKNDKFEKTKKS
jgi:hypothetical protein